MTVWEQRDLPVLRALATSEDDQVRSGFVSVRVGGPGEHLGLDLDGAAVHDAILALADAGYVEAANLSYETGPGAIFTGLRVTGRGQQALGEWPLFVEIASPDTLALLLERLAEEAPTEEEAANMRKAADYVRSVAGGALRALATGALAQAARIALGFG
jgi:hypothetical protein